MTDRRAAVALLLAAGFAGLAGCLQPSLEGASVPAFEVVTSEGQRVNETTHLGRYLVLDLMATWCAPCILEVAHLREVQRVHGDRVAILSVSVEPDDSMDDMEAFREEHGASWPYALDPGLRVASAMRLTTIPKLLVVDPQGIVVLEAEGEVLPAAIHRVIEGGPPQDALRLPWLPAGAAALAGFAGLLNPYRRLHREGPEPASTLAGLALLGLAGALVWPFAPFVSGRATLSSLAVGALCLAAVAWWAARARRKAPSSAAPSFPHAAGDRAYEAAPHLLLAVVLALDAPTLPAFVLVLGAFLAGAASAAWARPRLADRARVALGLAGLAAVGVALVAFGWRIVAAGEA